MITWGFPYSVCPERNSQVKGQAHSTHLQEGCGRGRGAASCEMGISTLPRECHLSHSVECPWFQGALHGARIHTAFLSGGPWPPNSHQHRLLSPCERFKLTAFYSSQVGPGVVGAGGLQRGRRWYRQRPTRAGAECALWCLCQGQGPPCDRRACAQAPEAAPGPVRRPDAEGQARAVWRSSALSPSRVATVLFTVYSCVSALTLLLLLPVIPPAAPSTGLALS